MGSGPVFNVTRGIVVEPLLFLFGSLVIAQCFGCHAFESILKSNNQYKLCLMTMACAIMITVVLGDYSAVLLLSNVCVTDPLKLALLSGTTLGATLSFTGSLSNILSIALVYDEVSYLEFPQNKCLPFIAALLIYAFALKMIVGRAIDVTETTKNAGYSGISAHDDGTDQEDKPPKDDTLTLDRGVETFEIDGAISLDQEIEPFPRWHVFVYFILNFMFYLAGLDVIMVCLCAAAVLLACFSWRRHQYDGEHYPSHPLTKLNYGLLVNVTAELLLTASLNDTNLPQAFIDLFLGDCAEMDMSPYVCLYRSAAMISLLCLTVSSMNANLMIAAIFPYSVPYDWMQVTLISSLIGNLAWSPFDRPQLSSRANFCMFTIPTAILSICAGVFILETVHVSPECSMRLGECS
jgi:hypothetical protein